MNRSRPICRLWKPWPEQRPVNGSELPRLPSIGEKIYPVDDMEQVVARLSENEDYTIFLLGGRGYEEAVLEQWAFQYPRVKSVVGRYSLDNELALISRLDVLLCMDSANMHFASLVDTKVISVWGSNASLCRILRLSSGPEKCRSTRSSLSSLFSLRPEALFSGGLGLYDTDYAGDDCG